MAKMVTVLCKSCKTPFEAREADRKRGWGRYCSKSCKAVRQTQVKGRRSKPAYPRHDGVSDMKHKFCAHCSSRAVNGVYTITGIEWLCEWHMAEASTHPFDSDALGQW